MTLTPYTSNDEVRAVLGVTSEELSDATLELDMYSRVLKMELDDIGDPSNDGDLADAFALVAEISESQRTKVQARLYDAVVLFAPFPVALHMETSLPLFAPKSITDGKAAITRNSASPFADIIKAARDNYDRFRSNLTRAWATYSSKNDTSIALPTLFAVSSPTNDPVTGA